jgi:uncharacterized spore protein YtfJ
MGFAGVPDNLETLFSKMENFITSKTVIGDAITVGNAVILPLVEVTFGVGAGGAFDDRAKGEKEAKSDGKKEATLNGGSGGGLGARLSPSAVVVIINDSVQLINLKNQDSVSKLLDMAPGVLQKLGSIFNKKDKETQKEAQKEAQRETAKDTIKETTKETIKETTLTETQVAGEGENSTVLKEKTVETIKE